MEERNILQTSAEFLSAVTDSPYNQKCFDCTDKFSPRYLCTNFSTFVCSCCANIHKEFGHTIKCLNIFIFSIGELTSLNVAGNKLAADKWLALWTPSEISEPDPTSPTYKEEARNYIRAKYIEGRWCLKDLGESKLPPSRVQQQHDGKPPTSYAYASSPVQSPRVQDPMTFPPSPYTRPHFPVPADFNRHCSPLGPIPFNLVAQHPGSVSSPVYNIISENPPPLPPRPEGRTSTNTSPTSVNMSFSLSPPHEYVWHPMQAEENSQTSMGMLRSSSDNSIGIYMRGLHLKTSPSSSGICDPVQLDKQGRAKWKVQGIMSKMADLLTPKKLATS